MKTAIIGLGYVGLPLSLQFARSGVTVLGLDVDTAKVDALNQGRSYIKHIPRRPWPRSCGRAPFRPPAISAASGKSTRSSSASRRRSTRTASRTFPTSSTPAGASRPTCSKGMLVVLESTTYPGTTDEDLREVLEIGSGLEAGTRFPPGLFARARRPGQSGQQSRRHSQGRRRVTPRPAWKRPWRSIPRRSRPSCRFHPAA